MLRFAASSPDMAGARQHLAHIPGAAEKAISRAINAALAKAKAETLRGAQERYTVSRDEFARGVRMIKASPKHLEAVFLVRGAPLRIAKFKVGKSPTTSEVIRGGVRQWPHGFLARMKSGHVGLFKRAERWGPKEGTEKTREATRGKSRGPVGGRIMRQPISEVSTVSSAQMAGHFSVIQETLDRASEKLRGELDRQIELFLSGKVS